MSLKDLSQQLGDAVQDYAALLLLGAGLLGIVALAALAVWVKRTKKPLRPLALSLSMNLALLLNAEGMWVIAVDQLKLPAVFAVLVFAVFEICFLTATSLAAEQYRRTTVYAQDGKTIVTPGHPGPMLWIAALIAVVSGVVVASNAATGTEKLLRLAIPCVIFLMWWAALTAAGQRQRARSRFAYSPRRLAERWGWLIPDDDPDLVKMAAERQVRRMVVNYQRVSGAGRPLRAWWRSRLLKDARTASDMTVAEVVEQLARIERVMSLLAPAGTDSEAPVSAQAEIAERVAAQALLTAGPAGERLSAVERAAIESFSGQSLAVSAAQPDTDRGRREVAAERESTPPMPVFSAPDTGEQEGQTMPEVGSPWWRLAIDRLARLVALEIGTTDPRDLAGLRLQEIDQAVSVRVTEIEPGMVHLFVLDYARRLQGEEFTCVFPWEDFLPVVYRAPSQEVTATETTVEQQSAEARMRAYWDSETAEGRVPSGADLARVGNVSPATGRRRRTEWEKDLPARELVESGRS